MEVAGSGFGSVLIGAQCGASGRAEGKGVRGNVRMFDLSLSLLGATGPEEPAQGRPGTGRLC